MKSGMRRALLMLATGVLAVLVMSSGCVEEAGGVKTGDQVKVHYTGTFENGTVFDSSSGREPIEFTVGANQMIPGFEAGVMGMQVGETKTVQIPADRAYGQYREDLLFLVDPESISGGENLTVGQQVLMTLPDGQGLVARVAGISPEGICIDANHPLAGEDLTFSIQVVEIG
jgi:peptidylprolyl isomerase